SCGPLPGRRFHRARSQWFCGPRACQYYGKRREFAGAALSVDDRARGPRRCGNCPQPFPSGAREPELQQRAPRDVSDRGRPHRRALEWCHPGLATLTGRRRRSVSYAVSGDAATAASEPIKPKYSDEGWPPIRQAYFAACVLAIVQMCAMLNNGVMTLLVEPVKRDLDLTDLEMSYLLGFSVVLFYAFVGIPAARLADRHNRKWLMTISVAVWSAATAACGLANSFWQFFAARFGIGAGESISGPLSYSLLADYFPPDKLPRGIAIYNVGLQGGNALSLLLGSFLIYLLA